MERSQCRKGMKVYFGQGRGMRTLGEVVKLNPTRAKVKLLEERGFGRGSSPGSPWNVPYEMMEPADPKEAVAIAGIQQAKAVVAKEQMKYSPFQDYVEQQILLAISGVYSGLSPENLSCDGEIPRYHVRQRRAELESKLRYLFRALGREVDELEVIEWVQAKEKYERERKVV